MNSVYVVTLSDRFSDHVMNVFSSEEAAEKWIAKQDKEEDEYWWIHTMFVMS